MSKQLLKLFILGYTPLAKRAIRNLETICKTPKMQASYTIEVINLYEHPEYAEQEKILATPLLIIKSKPMQRRIIGDLSNMERVLASLCVGENYEGE